MGSTRYDLDARYDRASKAGYGTKSAGEIFTQNAKRMAHESMNPHGISFRESRDSEVHPHSVPIILGLDVTGSMGHMWSCIFIPWRKSQLPLMYGKTERMPAILNMERVEKE